MKEHLQIFTRNLKPEDIGKHVLFEHHPFHNNYCIELFLKNKRRRAKDSDLYLDIWKKERKIK